MQAKLLESVDLLLKNLKMNAKERKLLGELKLRIKGETPNIDAPLLGDHPLLGKPYQMVVFSDGACRGNPGAGAYGVHVIQVSKSAVEMKEFFPKTTNNRMELQGIIEGLKFALKNEVSKVLVVTDSKYAIDGIRSWMAGWKKRGWKKADKKTPENLELWQELDELKASFEVLDLEWVKGHSGHLENERCDELANQALDEALS